MHRQTKATAILPAIKAAVALRDSAGGRPATCIVCGAPGAPVAHCVRRSQGGRGDTEQNIVTLCNECHMAHDDGLFMRRLRPLGFETQHEVQEYVKEYLRAQYPGWTEDSVKYHKYEEGKDG